MHTCWERSKNERGHQLQTPIFYTQSVLVCAEDPKEDKDMNKAFQLLRLNTYTKDSHIPTEHHGNSFSASFQPCLKVCTLFLKSFKRAQSEPFCLVDVKEMFHANDMHANKVTYC